MNIYDEELSAPVILCHGYAGSAFDFMLIYVISWIWLTMERSKKVQQGEGSRKDRNSKARPDGSKWTQQIHPEIVITVFVPGKKFDFVGLCYIREEPRSGQIGRGDKMKIIYLSAS